MTMKILNNIATKETIARVTILISGVIVVIISLASILINNKAIKDAYEAQKQDIYLLDNGSILKAKLANNFKSPEIVAHKGFINLFHNYFWAIEPYPEYIEKNMEIALKMGDGSIALVKRLLEKESYFNTHISGRYSVRYEMDYDNTVLDYSKNPIEFTMNGKLLVIRNNDIIEKELKTTGNIIKIGNTESNFTGFYIQDYKVEVFKKTKTLKYSDL